MEEIIQNDTTTNESTANVTNSEATIEENSTPFKTYQTQEDFDKEIKSLSMRRINDLYKELNVKSKEELKEALGYKGKFTELETQFKTLESEYTNYKTANEKAAEEKEELTRQLALSKLGITDNKELREDFLMAVDALCQKKQIPFSDAATEYLNRHPEYRDMRFGNGLKIGTEKSNLTSEPETGVEKAFRKINSTWYK